ncbi:helitron helicase-like protein [Nitzschia inconspicua]|uniref:Helitron helicase-like protein n=1 Tax=Nitzschia inconspicua TaxID=303405 RepID=A0A9K3PX79_9STRA|nr:helitron helicase-like protein [Nitzschia inconspicua]
MMFKGEKGGETPPNFGVALHIPTIETVKKAAVGAVRDLNNLTFYDDTSATYKTKVCAICDRFILHGKECKITLEALQDKKVKELLRKKSLKWNSDVPSNVKLSLTKYYTCKAFDTGIGSTRWIREYVLSPRAFRAKAGKKDAPRAFRAKAGKKDAVGSCKLCAYEIKKARRGDTVAPSLPTYSIANGLMIGKAPLELTRLNDVEKALIARARIDKHIFSFEAGSHKSTKGWHTMFYNEVNAVLGVSNWSESVMRLNDSDSDSDSESTDNMHPETRDGKVVQVQKKSIPEICVILSGPCTPTQKAKVFKKTKIDWSHVKNALLWLKTYNRLYADVDAETYINVTPRIVDESESVASGNNNIEDVYEVFAVFPDNNVPHHTTGGCENSGELKELTIKHLLSKENCKEVSLISRPTRNILRDYQGDNLLLAFPVLFPYGLGSRDANDEPRLGTGYLRHLCCLSERNFHQATWVCILYNMLERQRLIRASYLKTREEEREMFCQISCNDIAGAMARYTDNVFGNHPADIFLRRMRAVTGSMSHCAGAARKARQRMFAMTAALGLPCVMFTVTPKDGINFRIRVMFKGEKGSETPPNFVLDEETLCTFISESEHIRFDHPGLCAIDFENVIGITVEHILGWDLNKNINKPGYGFFGDLDGKTFAVEEQGRKTLHAHFLLWIKGWGKLRSGLGTAKGHEEYVKQVSKYGDRVMCTRLHGFSSRLVPKVCHNDCSNTGEGTEGYQKCTTQDLRQLQTKQGETSLGAKKILFCSVCKASLSSEDVTLQRLKKYYGDALAGEDENFWSSSRYLTKCRVLMEMEVLHSMLPPKYAYVNVHSEFASILFGCNTNVITGVDGGSVMYFTCYVSKNAEKEDNKHFADAAKHMVKNMQQQMADRKELLDIELEEEASSVGLKGMIGAALMATKVHKVAAPMASYLIRNGSGFHFSHNFSYVDIGSFFKAIQEDLNISADEDGSVFLKSSVSNYLCRPKELEEVCVYDFESQ